MKNCPRCGSTVSENGMFCLNCGYKYSDETQISDEHDQNNEENSSNTYGQNSDLSWVLSALAIVFSSASICIVLIGSLVIGFAGTALGVVVCIISLIMAINAYHADESKTLAKVGIWLSFGFLMLNIVFSMACISLCGGISSTCSSSTCSNKPLYCDGAQFNPFY